MRSIILVLAISAGVALVPGPAKAQVVATASYERGPRFLLARDSKVVPVDVTKTPVLARRLNLDLAGATLKDALTEIESQSGLRFAYSDDAVPLEKRVHLRAEAITAAAALTDVLFDAGVDVVFKPDGSAALVKRPPAPPTGSINGRVTNAQSGEVLQGVEVYIQGTQRRTLTGADGQYRLTDVDTGTYVLAARRIGYIRQSRSITVTEGQEVTADFALQAAVTQLDELVTAQKREERLIDVPQAVSVLSADDIERRNLVSRENYLRSIPSVSSRENGPGLNDLIIRGAYGEPFRTGPTVGIYLGDVPLAGYAIGGSADVKLVDIERVEVLRGPQGTLYGSNALSGAVRYIPAAPDLQDFAGHLDLGYSRTGRFGGDNTVGEGVVNVPLVKDNLALRVAAHRHDNQGYVRNIAGDDPVLQAAADSFGAEQLAVNKDHVGSDDYTGVRATALWRPIDDLGFTLTYLKQNVSQADRPFEQRQFGRYQRSEYQFGNTIGGNDDALRIDLNIVNLAAQYNFGWGTLYSSTSRIDQLFIRKWDIGSLLTTLTGGIPAPIPQLSKDNAGVFAEEVRLTSDLDGPFQFIAGLYYEDSEQFFPQPNFWGGDPALNPFAAVKLWETYGERLVKQKAAFGELSYDLRQKIAVTVGGRFFRYDSRFVSILRNSVVLPESSSDTEAGENGHLFKAGIKYAPNEDALIYGTWSQGFRLGRPLPTSLISSLCDTDQDGFLDGTSIPSSLDKIASDGLDSYELGAKLTLMGGRAALTTAIYHNDWTDFPVSVMPPGCLATTTINGGSARARGLEVEGKVHLSDGVRVNLGFGYVNSVLTATTSAGRKGDKMNLTPEFNGNLGVEYNFGIAGYKAFIRGDYQYFGPYYEQTGKRGARADPYSLVNLGAGMPINRIDVTVRVDNLLNSDAITNLGAGFFPSGYAVRLRPRTVGVRLGYSF